MVDGGFVDATTLKDSSIGGAAGGMQSTGRDLLKFGAALFDGTLLSPESQAAMQTFVPGEDLSAFGLTHGYGLGLEQYVSDAVTVLGHLGTGLQGSFLGYDPASRHARRRDVEHPEPGVNGDHGARDLARAAPQPDVDWLDRGRRHVLMTRLVAATTREALASAVTARSERTSLRRY